MSNLNEQKDIANTENADKNKNEIDLFKCPHCGSDRFYKKGKTTKIYKYLCKKCDKKFTSTINTTADRELMKKYAYMLDNFDEE